jgi:hypothetical protein
VDSWSVIWLVALGGLGIGIALAARGDRFDRTLGVVLSILATLFVLDLIAISADFHGASGFMDCWPYCSTWQEVVNRTFWWGGMLLVALIVGGIVSAAWSSLRSRSR